MPGNRKMKFLPLHKKLEIIEKSEAGVSGREIGRQYDINESTVRGILKKRADIRRAIKAYGSSAIDNRKRASSWHLVKMERYLNLWIQRKESDSVPIDRHQIKEQAKIMFEAICRKEKASTLGFKASNGWLNRFLARKNLRRLNLTGEVASADTAAGEGYPAIFREMLEEGGYNPELVYNMDETGLFYKSMPKSTYVSRMAKRARGRKVDKTRITVLLCANQPGTNKMKPLVVHTAKKPRCYKNLTSMDDCPVHWRSGRKAWITSAITKDWLLQCFVPEAREHARKLGIPFKALLTMDNCPGHQNYLAELHPDVRVVFLPPNTTSLLQPLDQEIISTVKAKFRARVFRRLRQATETNAEVEAIMRGSDDENDEMDELPDLDEEVPQAAMTVFEFWRKFTVKDAVDNLLAAWQDVTPACVRHGWRKLTPHLCEDDMAVGELAQEVATAVAAAREVPGFGEVSEVEVLGLDQDVITTQDVIDQAAVEDRLQEELQTREEGEGDETPAVGPVTFSRSALAKALACFDDFQSALIECDPSERMSAEALLEMRKPLRRYEEILAKLVNESKSGDIRTMFERMRDRREQVNAESAESAESGAGGDDSGVTCSGELEDAEREIDELMMDDSEVTEADFEGFMAELAELELNQPGPSSLL